MALAEFAREGHPPGALGAGGELRRQHGLAGAAQACERPVRVQRAVDEEPFERLEQLVAAREIGRGDAVARTERVDEMFGCSCLGCAHGEQYVIER